MIIINNLPKTLTEFKYNIFASRSALAFVGFCNIFIILHIFRCHHFLKKKNKENEKMSDNKGSINTILMKISLFVT